MEDGDFSVFFHKTKCTVSGGPKLKGGRNLVCNHGFTLLGSDAWISAYITNTARRSNSVS